MAIEQIMSAFLAGTRFNVTNIFRKSKMLCNIIFQLSLDFCTINLSLLKKAREKHQKSRKEVLENDRSASLYHTLDESTGNIHKHR